MKISVRGLLAVGLLATSITASGSPITYHFSGALSLVSGSMGILEGVVEVGTPFTVALTFDQDTPPSRTDLWQTGGVISIFESSTFNVSVVIGGTRDIVWEEVVGAVIDDSGDAGDQVLFVPDGDPLVFDMPRMETNVFQVRAFDFSAELLSTSESLPTLAQMLAFDAIEPDYLGGFGFYLSAFTEQEDLPNSYIGYYIAGPMDLVRMPVPEPGTLALLSMGLLGLGLSRRTRAYRTGGSEKEGYLCYRHF